MSNLKNVAIDDLKPGMFVQSVLQQKGRLQVKTKGLVKSEEVIAALRKKGLTLFCVDLSKSKMAEEVAEEQRLAAKAEAAKQKEEEPEKKVEKTSFEDEINRAAKLYKDAKQVQQKLLKSMKMGLPVDLEPIQKMSDQFVGSLQRNPNALLCMTHLREKDAYLLEHSLNVAILMGAFGNFLELDEKIVSELTLAGMLHDVGKVEIPDNILLKPGALTPAEMTIMQSHVNKGLEALELIPGVSDLLLEVVGQNHERLDGSGYPNGIKGDDISIYGRMIGIIDCYDAMTADRCYQKGMQPNQALKVLLKMSATELDKDLVARFIKYIGIHPVGSLVKLDSEKVSLVTEHNQDSPLCPKVKSFYSLRSKHYLTPKEVDLADKRCGEKIVSPLREQELKINFKKFFDERISVG